MEVFEYNDYPPQQAANEGANEIRYVLQHTDLAPKDVETLWKALTLLRRIAND